MRPDDSPPSLTLNMDAIPKNTVLLTGPLLVGIGGNWWLYGILCVQYYMYLVYMSKDRKMLKAIVHFIFIVDTAQTALVMADAFYWFGDKFGDVHALYDFKFSSIDLVLLDAVIAFVVQLVYCWRIRILSEWKIIPIAISLLSLTSLVSGMIVGIVDTRTKTITAYTPLHRVPILIWLFASAIADVCIASSMTYLLLKMRSETIKRSTSTKIRRILTLTLETNAITAAVAIEIVIIFFVHSVAPPRSNIYKPGGFLLGKLYSNCFMVLLNQRRRSTMDIEFTSYAISDSAPSAPSRRPVTEGHTLTALVFARDAAQTVQSINMEPLAITRSSISSYNACEETAK